jgi:hypothetical protein
VNKLDENSKKTLKEIFESFDKELDAIIFRGINPNELDNKEHGFYAVANPILKNSFVETGIVKRIKKYDFESINAILKKFLVQFSEIMSVKEDFSNP